MQQVTVDGLLADAVDKSLAADLVVRLQDVVDGYYRDVSHVEMANYQTPVIEGLQGQATGET